MVDLLNKQVKHSGAFGIGTVTKQDDKYITICKQGQQVCLSSCF